jgi:hypothetical protein
MKREYRKMLENYITMFIDDIIEKIQHKKINKLTTRAYKRAKITSKDVRYCRRENKQNITYIFDKKSVVDYLISKEVI